MHGTTHAGAASPREPVSYATRRRAAGSLSGRHLFSTDQEFAMGEIRDLENAMPRLISCQICQHEIPLSEAVVSEASDYVVYFCGLDCYERWRTQRDAQGAVRQD
jgi:hypothetical protein